MKKLFKSLLLGSAIAVCGFAGQADAVVVESFETGSWGPGWSNLSAGVVNTGSAHDGAYGVFLDGVTWTSNYLFTVSEGSTISAWVRPTGYFMGRVYLGFGADIYGTQSFVSATNTNEIMFQDNTGYLHTKIIASPQAWTNSWYLMEIDWQTGGTAIGNLYASDGTTLLNSISASGFINPTGGIALRGFGGWDLDTVTVNSTSPVPEPSTFFLVGGALAGAGLWSRKRKRA